MKPSVGLTLLTSSFMIFLTMVVLPALSSPLRSRQSRAERPPNFLFLAFRLIDSVCLQHQHPHFLILEPSFPKNRQHLEYLQECARVLAERCFYGREMGRALW